MSWCLARHGWAQCHCLRVCSGFSGAQQPRGGISGAGAAAGGARDGRGGDDPQPDRHVRETGGGEVHPGQHPALCRHVSQLAAQRLRQVGGPSGLVEGGGVTWASRWMDLTLEGDWTNVFIRLLFYCENITRFWLKMLQQRAGSLPRPHRGLFKGALQQWPPVFVVANLIDYPVPSPSSPSLPSSHKLVYLLVEEAKLAAWHSRGQTAVWVCAQQASSIKHGYGRIVGVCSLPCTDWYWCVWTLEEVNVGQSYRRSKRRKRRNYWMAVTQLMRAHLQLHSWIAYMYVCIYIVFFVVFNVLFLMN